MTYEEVSVNSTTNNITGSRRQSSNSDKKEGDSFFFKGIWIPYVSKTKEGDDKNQADKKDLWGSLRR
jgi:hypothetical protein